MNSVHELFESIGLILTTDIPKGGAYILPDGYYLDLKLNYDRGFYINDIYKTGTHGRTVNRIKELLSEKGYSYEYLTCDREFLEREFNCIKIQDGTLIRFERSYVELPPKPISDIQYEKLEDYLYYLASLGRPIEVHHKGRGLLRYNLSLEEPKSVIRDIREQYNRLSALSDK